MISSSFFNSPKCLHFIGILGHGMSALAYLCLKKGHLVNGSDKRQTPLAEHLKRAGATIHAGHCKTQVGSADMVIFSSVIDSSNPEIAQALAQGIPAISRGELLAHIVNGYEHSIVVSGSHGKTSVVGMLSFLLKKAGLDPTYLMGGQPQGHSYNAHLGISAYCICEGDESDQSFLHLNPKIGVILNIDNDHLSNYGGSFDKFQNAFLQFVQQIHPQGCLVVCADDPACIKLLANYSGRVITYGQSKTADIQAFNRQHLSTGNVFSILYQGDELVDIQTHLHGVYTVQNLLAAVAVLCALGFDYKNLLPSLSTYQGVKRRFSTYCLVLGGCEIDLVDDYCHHPREIEQCLLAAKQAYSGRRLVVVFEPHRYTRTMNLLSDFVKVLASLSILIILPTYGAGEPFDVKGSGEVLYQAIKATHPVGDVFYLYQSDQLVNLLTDLVAPDDVLLMLGAGSIGEHAQTLCDTCKV